MAAKKAPDIEGHIRGLGYLYQGIWLGMDPEAFKPLSFDLSDVSSVEHQEGFSRVIMKTGHVYIVFKVEDPRPPVRAFVDATIIDSRRKLPTDSQESVAGKRVLILPPPKKD